MPKTSPDVDRYIEKSAPFAQPILAKIRKAFHKASPEIEEAMKWSFPHFVYKGMLGSMASFKEHVSWGFWKGKLMSDRTESSIRSANRRQWAERGSRNSRISRPRRFSLNTSAKPCA